MGDRQKRGRFIPSFGRGLGNGTAPPGLTGPSGAEGTEGVVCAHAPPQGQATRRQTGAPHLAILDLLGGPLPTAAGAQVGPHVPGAQNPGPSPPPGLVHGGGGQQGDGGGVPTLPLRPAPLAPPKGSCVGGAQCGHLPNSGIRLPAKKPDEICWTEEKPSDRPR